MIIAIVDAICYNNYYPLSTTITNAVLWEALEWEDDAFKQSLESIFCIFSFFDIYSLHYNVVVIIYSHEDSNLVIPEAPLAPLTTKPGLSDDWYVLSVCMNLILWIVFV